MKFSIFKILVLLSPIVASAATVENRIYIPQEHLALQNNKIYVQIHDEWLQIKTLRSDENGVFVNAKDFPLGYWQCQNCSAMNPPWRLNCWKCER